MVDFKPGDSVTWEGREGITKFGHYAKVDDTGWHEVIEKKTCITWFVSPDGLTADLDRSASHPAAETGAQREKLTTIPYDLVPFQEITDAYVRVAEFGAKKYTRYWENECQGLLNASNVAKIEITLPEICVSHAITRESSLQNANLDRLQNVLYAEKQEQSKSLAQASVAVVTKNDSRQPMLSITSVKSKTLESIIEKTQDTGKSRSAIEQVTLFLEHAINEHTFSIISEILVSRNLNTKNIETEGAPSATPLLIFTLTTITGRVYSEEFFAQDVTTVSGFWATISKGLKDLSVISENDIRVKSTGCWNWSKGLPRVQILCSLLRHTFAYLRGEERDSDSKLLHTDHIIWNAATLVHSVHWGLADGRRIEPPRDYKKALDEGSESV